MTQEEILEYNKNCVEFLGWNKTHPKIKDWHIYITPIGYVSYDKMLFHSDWNWIMEIKQHIVGLGFCWFQFPDTIQINENSTISSKSICKIKFNKLKEKEALVEAINQFLIWYNKNK